MGRCVRHGDACPAGKGTSLVQRTGAEQHAWLREAQQGWAPQSCEFLRSFVSGIGAQPGALLRINYPLTRFRFFPFVLF